MSDLTISTDAAVLYGFARQLSRQHGRLWPFPVGHTWRVVDGKLKADLEAFQATLDERREAMAEVDAEGGKRKHPDGRWLLSAANEAQLETDLKEVTERPITISGVTKVKAAALAGVSLTDIEQDGYAPFIED